MEPNADVPKELKLPLSIISQVDVARLIRELDSLNDFFTSADRREAGAPQTPPRLTRSLNVLAHDNQLNLLEEKDRTQLGDAMNRVLKSAPTLHISFAAEPQPKFIDQILTWLRNNIDQHLLLQVGLQPTIAAGCVVRTPNKVFDLSLRSYLKQQEPYLERLIAGVGAKSGA